MKIEVTHLRRGSFDIDVTFVNNGEVYTSHDLSDEEGNTKGALNNNMNDYLLKSMPERR